MATEPVETDTAAASTRLIATVIVITTLMAAIIGLLLNHASTESARAGDQAQRFGLQASAQLPAERQRAESDYFNYVVQRVEARKAGALFYESLFNTPSQQHFTDLQSVSDDIAAQTAKNVVPELTPGSPVGPDVDPDFPQGFLTVRTEQATKLSALQDGENALSARWSNLTAAYSAILTLVAVALFLLGASIGLGGRPRRLFVGVGLMLISVGGLWAVRVSLERPSNVSEAAAAAFTLGQHWMAVARTPEDYDKAIAAFTTAIEHRPDDGLSYRRRAVAEEFRGSQHIGGGFVSNQSDEWLAKATSDMQQAYALGQRDADTTGSLAFILYATWLRHGSGHLPGAIVRLAQQTTELDPTDPISWLNLGVLLLADGQTAPAEAAYRAGLDRILYVDVDKRTLRTGATRHEREWLAGGLTDLDNLGDWASAHGESELHDEVGRLKAMLATAIATGGGGSAGTTLQLASDAIDIDVGANGMSLTITPPSGWDPAGGTDMRAQAVTVVWYERPSGNDSGPWNTIANITSFGNTKDSSPLSFDESNKTYWRLSEFLLAEDECFPDADYRAEVYVNGSLAGSKAVSGVATGNLKPALDREMRTGLCVPKDWERLPTPTGQSSDGRTKSLDGVLFGYQSPDGSHGAYVFRIYPNRDGFVSTATPALHDLVGGTCQYAIKLLTNHPLPSDIEVTNEDHALASAEDTEDLRYASAATDLEARVSGFVTGDKAIKVVVVYGLKGDFDNPSGSVALMNTVFHSLGQV